MQLRWTGILEPGIDGQTAGEVAQVDLEGSKRQGGRHFGGWFPLVEGRLVPVQETTGRFFVDFSGQTANPGESLGPGADQVAPNLVVLLLGRLTRLAKGLLKLV